jgi:predicted phosphodiesterase
LRYLILSDVHANFEALTAVIRHVRRKRFDHVIFMGNAVGYGAAPNRVVDWLRAQTPGLVSVRGNHDRVCAGLEGGEYFNRYALEAANWTNQRLTPRNLEFVLNLPKGPVEVNENLAVCHGSTVDEDAYIFSGYDAQLAFDVMPQGVVLFGHTHIPSVFTLRNVNGNQTLKARLLSGRRQVLDLDGDARYLINPGSVGQPRDRDPRAAYAIFDDEISRLYIYRVGYRVAEARKRIVQAGLPPILGDRLLYGA